ncbi:MAG: response regulator [Rhodospirillales bacterium]|nr:response regulator [Rhodospirillales bacterium]
MNQNGIDTTQPDQTKPRQTILVVDDDHDFAMAMAESLEIYGYTAKTANTAEDALAVATTLQPDGLLLDLRLGERNGLELLPALRRLFPDLVCIIVTGYPDMETAIGALRHRADDYFRKPFPPQDVCKVLDRCFRRIVAKRQGEAGRVRENFFGRLLVRRFSTLFVENESNLSGEKVLSRSILPGFFVAVDMMLGPERVEEYQKQCQDIVKRLSDGDRTRLSWDEYYSDPEAVKLALDAQIKMALHFREIDKRVIWLTTLINNHVGSVAHRPAGQAITPRDTITLLSFLFADLTAMLSTESGRRFVFRQYGQDTFARLASVADRFRPETVR